MNNLTVLEFVDHGAYLDDGDQGQILLPNKYVPENCEIGQAIDVFICYDSDDRLVAVTDKPYAMVGDFALLKVVAVERVGAFVDWGLPKDLMVPFSEQIHQPRVGDDILVHVYLDNTQRIAASMRMDRFLGKTANEYLENQAVELIVAGKTDLGFKVIVEGKHWAVLYTNEVFQPLHYGQKISGFIKKPRLDGKIDVALSLTGHKAADPIADKILALLKENNGFLDLTDKTEPDRIYRLFGVSKKKYKIALGGLYKKKKILVTDQGIKLL